MRFFVCCSITANPVEIHLHLVGCTHSSDPAAMEFLGEFDSYHDAVQAGVKRFGRVVACRHCCPESSFGEFAAAEKEQP